VGGSVRDIMVRHLLGAAIYLRRGGVSWDTKMRIEDNECDEGIEFRVKREVLKSSWPHND
jgi:hypothetical protein